jgi:hypothetical protein
MLKSPHTGKLKPFRVQDAAPSTCELAASRCKSTEGTTFMGI